MTRHSREDALTDREFELLLEGAKEPLQNFMGWKKIATAEKYMRSSGKATAMELRAPK